jgi:hypothetical protein
VIFWQPTAIAKLVIGIISIALFLVIMFQSCSVGVESSLQSNSDDLSGSAGMLIAIAMLIGGAIGSGGRKSRGASITAGVIYILAALIGFANLGTFGDLVVWAVVALAFGLVFILESLKRTETSQVSTDSESSISEPPQLRHKPQSHISNHILFSVRMI